jgi:hypothetical protein
MMVEARLNRPSPEMWVVVGDEAWFAGRVQ